MFKKVNKLSRHPGESRDLVLLSWMKIPAFAGMTVLLFCLSCLAAENLKAADAAAPCEFNVTFPSKPKTEKHCDGADQKTCYDQISYTKIYDAKSRVNFRATCTAMTEAMQQNYTQEVMDATLRAMTLRSSVERFDTSYRTADHYRQAGLAGEGHIGSAPVIYIAQLWIGEASALTVEAELIGPPHPRADEIFSNFLRSVKYKK